MDLQKSETAYRVLARKYRPQNFSDLIGQEPMVRTLTNAFNMGRIAQAWMLTGVRGVGKTTTARILARALNYKTETIDKPTVHLEQIGEHCQAIMEGRHVDVMEMDAASHTGIDDIREIIEQIRYRPVSARYKVYIIDEVHMLSTQAFNGLLKTLEEPPPHAKFIFATTEIRKVPVTVLSRCQRFDLRRVDSAELMRHLQKIATAENVKAEEQALAMIARAGEGSVRDCLSILDQAIAHSGTAENGGTVKIQAAAVRLQLGLADKSQIIDLFRFLMQGQPANALAQIQKLYEYGADPSIMIRELLDFNHFITRLKFQPSLAEDISLSEEERQEGKQFAEKLSVRVLSRSWQMLLKGLHEVENSARPLAAAEMLLIRLCHAAELPHLDDSLRLLAQQEQNQAKQTPQLTIKVAKTIVSKIENGVTNADKAVEQATTAIPKTSQSAEIEPKAETISPLPAKPLPAKQQQTEAARSPAQSAEGQDLKKNPEFSLRQLVKMAEKQGKLQLKFHLREAVRPVLMQMPEETAAGQKPGLIRFVSTPAAPPDIERQIKTLLMEATNEHWLIERVEEGGGATLSEEEARQKQVLIDDAEKNADVLAVLRCFTQAKLVDVRLENDNPLTYEAEIAAAENFDENDSKYPDIEGRKQV